MCLREKNRPRSAKFNQRVSLGRNDLFFAPSLAYIHHNNDYLFEVSLVSMKDLDFFTATGIAPPVSGIDLCRRGISGASDKLRRWN
jgi:hypothetical protein